MDFTVRPAVLRQALLTYGRSLPLPFLDEVARFLRSREGPRRAHGLHLLLELTQRDVPQLDLAPKSTAWEALLHVLEVLFLPLSFLPRLIPLVRL